MREIMFFSGISLEVVEFKGFSGLWPYTFPVPFADGLLKATFMEFPIEEVVMIGLRLTQ